MRAILLILLVALITACSSTPTTDERQAAELYNSAKEALNRGDYQTAVSDYETLQSRYPFGVYADQAQLDIIYAYSQSGEPDSAVAAADRFIRLNPRHERVDYAWYMRGVVEQERGQSFITRLFGLDRERRDPQPLERAFDTFRTLIQRFPDSQYVEDARRRMVDIREDLAAHDLDIARFYQAREDWVAVANRARRIVQRYPDSSAVDDALELLRQSYTALDLQPLRQDIERILEINGIRVSGSSARETDAPG